MDPVPVSGDVGVLDRFAIADGHEAFGELELGPDVPSDLGDREACRDHLLRERAVVARRLRTRDANALRRLSGQARILGHHGLFWFVFVETSVVVAPEVKVNVSRRSAHEQVPFLIREGFRIDFMEHSERSKCTSFSDSAWKKGDNPSLTKRQKTVPIIAAQAILAQMS